MRQPNWKTRWRASKKRGVSPIIATILLVAITVVLAAVLYILISGLTKGPGNTPVGSAFGFGTQSTETGAATGCVATHLCYVFSVAQASSGLTLGGLNWQVKTPAGAFVAITSINVLNIGGTAIGTWTPGGGWTLGTSVVLATTMSLVYDTGAGALLTGDSFSALGVGSFSGQVTTTLT